MKRNGRDNSEPPHARHYGWQMRSSAWLALSPVARCLELELKMLFNGSNNGSLFFSVRDAAKKLGVVPNTAAKAFKELQEKGFIRPNQKGSFKWKKRHATTWILTEFSVKENLPTKDFMRWHPTKNTDARNDTVSSKE